MTKQGDQPMDRRRLLSGLGRAVLALGLTGWLGWLVGRRGTGVRPGSGYVWQVDPLRCIQCGRCATACVLTPSAVKCVHTTKLCGYCNRCFAFLESEKLPQDIVGTAAEYQRCPTDAIVRRFIEEPYYEYSIDKGRCIGCGRCVKGCAAYGNKSLYLQIRHDGCVHCNVCAIAEVCPSEAIQRVPARTPYRLKLPTRRDAGRT